MIMLITHDSAALGRLFLAKALTEIWNGIFLTSDKRETSQSDQY